MHKNKNELKYLVFGAHLIAIAIILSKITKELNLRFPVIYISIWTVWFLPLIIISFLFPFRQTIMFILLFAVIEGIVHTIPGIVNEQTISRTFQKISNNSNNKDIGIIFKKWFLQGFIPILTYSIQPLLIKSKAFHKNYFLWFSLLVVLCASICRGINGYYYWYEEIKLLFEKKESIGNYNYGNNFWQGVYQYFKNSKTNAFIIIWFLNFVPIVISHLINSILFFLVKKNIIKLYENF